MSVRSRRWEANRWSCHCWKIPGMKPSPRRSLSGWDIWRCFAEDFGMSLKHNLFISFQFSIFSWEPLCGTDRTAVRIVRRCILSIRDEVKEQSCRDTRSLLYSIRKYMETPIRGLQTPLNGSSHNLRSMVEEAERAFKLSHGSQPLITRRPCCPLLPPIDAQWTAPSIPSPAAAILSCSCSDSLRGAWRQKLHFFVCLSGCFVCKSLTIVKIVKDRDCRQCVLLLIFSCQRRKPRLWRSCMIAGKRERILV